MRKTRWATLLTVLALSGVAARGAAQPLDLNGDGREDILLQMPLTPDAVGAWLMGANGQPATFTTLPSPSDWSISVPECSGNQLTTVTDRGPWRVIGSTDYNRDGIPDLVFAGSLNTAIVALRTNTGAVSSVATLYAPTVTEISPVSGTGPKRCSMGAYTAVATADLDGDGVNDLVLQTRRAFGASGDVIVRFATGATSPVAQAGDWRVVGSTDLNGDGIPDLVLQYPGSGYVGGWVMNRAGSPTQFVPVAWFDTGGWLVAGTADLNGDGVKDLLLQHPSGWAGAWTMSRTGSPSGFTFLSTAPITPWTMNGARSVPEPKPRLDFNGDGREDIPLMYPGVPGPLGAWLIGPQGTPQSFASIADTSAWEMVYGFCFWPFGGPATAQGPWRVVGVLDQNQDGITDLVFSERGTGNTLVLLRDRDGRPARLDVLREMTYSSSTEPSSCSPNPANVVALADVDGDGRDDLVIQTSDRYTPSPYVTIKYATGSETVVAGTVGMGGWRVAAVMDLNADTIPDLVLQDNDSGQVGALLLDRSGGTLIFGQETKTTATEFREITDAGTGGWWVAGTVDVNADGIPDLMLQQESGSIGVWEMNSAGQPTTFRVIADSAIAPWTVYGWLKLP